MCDDWQHKSSQLRERNVIVILLYTDKIRKMRDCDHFFHKDCIDNWLLIKSNCPYCRKDCSVRKKMII